MLNIFERVFEGIMWRSRFIVILAVVFGLVGSVILFIVASIDIFHIAEYTISHVLSHSHPADFHEKIVVTIIGAIDLYLIAVVMLLFAFGLYELFISEIDEAKSQEHKQKILTITSLDQLKDKIAKVIVMVLVVSFFQKVLHTQFTTPIEMLYFAISITALAGGLHLLHKVSEKH
jgi:uncharacterized protein (TIGR00645 family)